MIHAALARKQRFVVLALLLLTVVTVVIGMGVGASSVSLERLIPTILGHGTFKDHFVLFSIRLPRVVVTLLAGMALALSGSILQGITRNDLADPGIVGINAGAGVAIAVFFLYAPIEPGSLVYVLPIVAFAGAFLTAGLIYAFSYSRQDGLNPVKLVLVGVGFAMALSGVMIVIISATEPAKVDFIAKWLAGNVWGADWPFVYAMLPWLALIVPYVVYKANTLNLLSMNESIAIGAGVRVERERIGLLVAAVALAAAAVSVTGGVAFIGLLAPHIAKALVGPRFQLFIPVSVLLGGWLLLTADTIGHNIVGPEGVPAGIMVALIGAPYFLYLMLRK